MKNIIMLLIATMSMHFASGQKIKSSSVPASVVSGFKQKFPNVKKAKWEMETATIYEAEFKQNGEEISANFDANGAWLETETEIEAKDLPQSISDKLKADFNGYEIEEASKIESAALGFYYEVEIEKGESNWEILIKEDGTILEKKPEEVKGHKKD